MKQRPTGEPALRAKIDSRCAEIQMLEDAAASPVR